MTRRLVPVLLVALVLALPAWADMAESLKREFHDERELGVAVVTDSTLGELDRLLANKEMRVLCLQVTAPRLDEERAARIMAWVREGHTLWFYDARAAGLFGMRPYLLKSEQFRSRPEDGDLGDRSWQGAATTVLATGPHAVLAGVGQATIFMPAWEEDTFGAVSVEGDTLPLLQFAPDSPALAALRRDGRGLVVFKPLLWTKPLSGERFQLNLLEYSAGFGVPGVGGEGRYGNPPGPQAEYVQGNPAVPPAGSGGTAAAAPPPPPVPPGPEGPGNRVVATPLPKASPSAGPEARPSPRAESSPSPRAVPAPSPAPPAVLPSPSPSPAAAPPPPAEKGPPAQAEPFPDRLEVSGEGTVEARVLSELRFETTGESLILSPDQLVTVTIRSPMELDRVVTRDGRTLSGFLMVEELQVAVPDGTRTLRKKQVVRIDFGAAR